MHTDQLILMHIAAKRYPLRDAIAEWLGYRRLSICEKVANMYPRTDGDGFA